MRVSNFGSYLTQRHRTPRASKGKRFAAFMEALGANSATRTLVMPLVGVDLNVALPLLQHMHQVAKLRIVTKEWRNPLIGQPVPDIDPELLRILPIRMPLIVEIEIALSTPFYTQLLPTVAEFPLLESVHLYDYCSRDSIAVSEPAAQAMGDLVTSQTSLREFILEDHKLDDDRCAEFIWKGLRSSTVRRIQIKRCRFRSGDALALTLASMPLTMISLDTVQFQNTSQSVFFPLTSPAWSFAVLEVFHYNFGKTGRIGDPEIGTAAMTAVVGQIRVRAPYLKRIHLGLVDYKPRMDQALSEFSDKCPQLETITVDLPKWLRYSAPALLQAVSNSWTLQVRFIFKKRLSSHDAISDDPDMAKRFRIMSDLNRAGRVYAQSDPTDWRKGLDVLAQVSENLDCLYFHLRENPLICERGRPMMARMPQKRKAVFEGDDRPTIRSRGS